MDTLNWVLTAIGTIGGIPVLLAGGYQVFKYFRPLKITLFGTAYYEYHPELREYIVIVREVEVHVRRPLTTKARCIQIGDDKKCYPNAEALFRASDRWEQSGVHTMRFTPELYTKDDMSEDLRSEGVTKGRIVIGRCKSDWFSIKKVNIFGDGDIIIRRRENLK